MVPPTLTDTSKVTGSEMSSPGAGCGLTSVMVATRHIEADWQSAGSVSRHKANTGISLRNIQPPFAPSSYRITRHERSVGLVRSGLDFTPSDAISMPIVHAQVRSQGVCLSCLCEAFGF